jgi:hypothetical protein
MRKYILVLLIVILCAAGVKADEAGALSAEVGADLSSAGVTVTAGVMKPAVVALAAEDVDEGQLAYDSLTGTADFNYRPAYVESKYSRNELLQDIAVSAVEAVPFGFLLTFAGIYVYEAAAQSSYQPVLKTLQDYTPAYAISIGSLAALNVLINTLFFYEYKDSKAEIRGSRTKE